MAQSDLNSYVDNEVEAVTATEGMAPYGPNPVDAQAAAAALAHGVKRASQIDYAIALKNYTDRTDIESLKAYNARTYPTSFHDSDYLRHIYGTASASEPSDS